MTWGRIAVALVLWASTGPAAPAVAQDPAESTCVTCHLEEEEEELRLPVPEWRESVHAANGVSCDACHGGDPHEEDADLSMSEEAGFLDNPSWTEAADYCGVCHEAIALHYEDGRFGQAIATGEPVPTCFSCHMADGHRIVEATPEEVHVPARCRGCLPVERGDEVVAILRTTRALDASARARVASVEARGIELGDLRTGLDTLRSTFTASVHEFDPRTIDAASALATAQLQAVNARAHGWERETEFRRRYGIALLAAFGVVFAALSAWGRGSVRKGGG